jgi:hypothetical protein
MGYGEYLRLLVREDQVFGLLLAWMTLNSLAAIANLARAVATAGLSPLFMPFQLAAPVLTCGMLIATLTLQRWGHTAVVWMAGMGLLFAALSLFGQFLSPLLSSSVASWLGGWFGWLLQTGTLVFVLIVLCERSAYFEGIHGRAPPKRRRLKDVWAGAKSDLRRVDPYEQRDSSEEETARATMPARHTRPSKFDPKAPAEAARPAGPAPAQMSTVARESVMSAGAPPQAPAAGQAKPPSVATCTRCGNEVSCELPGCPHCAQRGPVDDGGPAGGPAGKPVRTTAGASRGVSAPPPQPTGDDYRAEPVEVAAGQAGEVNWAGVKGVLNWTYVRALAREDKALGVVLAVLALQALLTTLNLNFVATAGGLAIIWGILTLQRWAYWFAMLLSAGIALWHLRLITVAQEIAGVGGLALYGAIGVLNLLVIVLLVARQERFG